MPVPPRRWNQRSQSLQQFEWRQDLAHPSAWSRLGAFIDQVFRVNFPQPFLREGRPGAVAEQALQTLPVVGLDADTGIQREAAAVLALFDGSTSLFLQQATAHELAHDPLPQRRRQFRFSFRGEADFLKIQRVRFPRE